jgi:AcrR family transcriptional regulator
MSSLPPDSPIVTPSEDAETAGELSGPKLLWLRPEPRQRPSRPARTRSEIARAAISIADGEGFEALTMRRVAAELGMATMSLYSHVASKDEMIELASDELLAEIVLERMPNNWREALTMIARRSREFFLRHPWVLNAADAWPTGGPNLMRHIEQTVAAVSTLELDRTIRWDVARAVDAYALGAASDEIQDERMRSADEERGGSLAHERDAFFATMLATGEYPHLAADVAAGGPDQAWDSPDNEARFERGLAWLLDGIAAEEAAALAKKRAPRRRKR